MLEVKVKIPWLTNFVVPGSKQVT